jgi:hypothetical protein
MSAGTGGESSPPDDEQRVHDRRYVLVAIGLAVVVLAFAAISIAVVVLAST